MANPKELYSIYVLAYAQREAFAFDEFSKTCVSALGCIHGRREEVMLMPSVLAARLREMGAEQPDDGEAVRQELAQAKEALEQARAKAEDLERRDAEVRAVLQAGPDETTLAAASRVDSCVPDCGPTDRDLRERDVAQERLQRLILADGETCTGGRWLFDAAADEIVRLRGERDRLHAERDEVRGILDPKRGPGMVATLARHAVADAADWRERYHAMCRERDAERDRAGKAETALFVAREELGMSSAKVRMLTDMNARLDQEALALAAELRAKAPLAAHGEPGKATGGDHAASGSSSVAEEQRGAQGAPRCVRCDAPRGPAHSPHACAPAGLPRPPRVEVGQRWRWARRPCDLSVISIDRGDVRLSGSSGLEATVYSSAGAMLMSPDWTFLGPDPAPQDPKRDGEHGESHDATAGRAMAKAKAKINVACAMLDGGHIDRARRLMIEAHDCLDVADGVTPGDAMHGPWCRWDAAALAWRCGAERQTAQVDPLDKGTSSEPTARDAVAGMLLRCGYVAKAEALAAGEDPSTVATDLKPYPATPARDACLAALKALARGGLRPSEQLGLLVDIARATKERDEARAAVERLTLERDAALSARDETRVALDEARAESASLRDDLRRREGDLRDMAEEVKRWCARHLAMEQERDALLKQREDASPLRPVGDIAREEIRELTWLGVGMKCTDAEREEARSRLAALIERIRAEGKRAGAQTAPTDATPKPWRGVEHEVQRNRWCQDQWVAEAIDRASDGAVFVAHFHGPRAEARAREYAAFVSSPAAGEPQSITAFKAWLASADDKAAASTSPPWPSWTEVAQAEKRRLAAQGERSDLEKITALQAEIGAGVRDGIERMLAGAEVMTSADGSVTLLARNGVESSAVLATVAELLGLPEQTDRIEGNCNNPDCCPCNNFCARIEQMRDVSPIGAPDREQLGRAVHEVWLATNEDAGCAPSAIPWERLRDEQKELDMRTGERLFAMGVEEGERRAKAKAAGLLASWEAARLHSLKLRDATSKSEPETWARRDSSALIRRSCMCELADAFDIPLPASPPDGQPPTGGEPGPEDGGGFPADVPPEVDEQIAEIAIKAGERVADVMAQRRDRIAADLGGVIRAAISENLLPHEIAHRVLRRMEHAHGFGAIASQRPAAGAIDRAHADGVVEGLRRAVGIVWHLCAAGRIGRTARAEVCGRLSKVIASAAQDVAHANRQPHVDMAALLALVEVWERRMTRSTSRAREATDAYVKGLNRGLEACSATCIGELRRLLDAPRGPGGGEREPVTPEQHEARTLSELRDAYTMSAAELHAERDPSAPSPQDAQGSGDWTVGPDGRASEAFQGIALDVARVIVVSELEPPTPAQLADRILRRLVREHRLAPRDAQPALGYDDGELAGQQQGREKARALAERWRRWALDRNEPAAAACMFELCEAFGLDHEGPEHEPGGGKGEPAESPPQDVERVREALWREAKAFDAMSGADDSAARDAACLRRAAVAVRDEREARLVLAVLGFEPMARDRVLGTSSADAQDGSSEPHGSDSAHSGAAPAEGKV